MFLLVTSFLAGVLTSLAPCVLPLLPVIVGSSILSGDDKKRDRRKPYIIAVSLVVSVIAFTLLLKVSTALADINPEVWTTIAGIIVVLLGISMVLPNMWVRFSAKIGFEHNTNSLLAKANKQSGSLGAVLTGAALGPVFSSCSPVYALVLATVLPVNLALGIVYIMAYALGLGLALLAISLAGRRLTAKLEWAVNPYGMFRRILGIILILVGLMIVTGYDKKFQVWTAEHLPFGIGRLEEKLATAGSENKPLRNSDGSGTVFNVAPYDAPELRGIADWINSDPLTLEELRGKVVLIDFWTYSCINCQRTQPYLNDWYNKYNNDGFVTIGAHAPEFAFEKIPDNVRQAVKDAGIKYPVALDNDFATWNAFENRFWPAKYLIDKDGQVRYTHFGEGAYDETEEAIQALLKESGKKITDAIKSGDGQSFVQEGQTPETYLNYERGDRFANTKQFEPDKPVDYTLVSNLKEHYWSLGGKWNVRAGDSLAQGKRNTLRIKFSAKELYLVMDGSKGAAVTMEIDGKAVTRDNGGGADVGEAGRIRLDGARLYKLINLPDFSEHTLDIYIPQGVSVNAFTFGS